MATSASHQPGRYKKRPIEYIEDSSEDEDVNMDLKSNDSSGSSVDSDHVPAKRHRASTIVTRSSKSTTSSGVSVTQSDSHYGVVSDHSSSLSEPETGSEGELSAADPYITSPDLRELEIGTETETETETEPEIPTTRANVAFPFSVNVTEDATTNTAPTPRRSPAVDMIVDESSPTSGTHDATRTHPRRACKAAKTPVFPPQPPSPSPDPGPALKIPSFLEKKDLYNYLTEVKETGFRDLLKGYVTFELADCSGIRGTLTTTRRPKAIEWWTGRARPCRIPPFDSLQSFANRIIQWWITVQPGWRKIEPRKSFCDEGDWEDLYQPGVNGLLNVVILAHWWARILEERGNAIGETYPWFISDVAWVLS